MILAYKEFLRVRASQRMDRHLACLLQTWCKSRHKRFTIRTLWLKACDKVNRDRVDKVLSKQLTEQPTASLVLSLLSYKVVQVDLILVLMTLLRKSLKSNRNLFASESTRMWEIATRILQKKSLESLTRCQSDKFKQRSNKIQSWIISWGEQTKIT